MKLQTILQCLYIFPALLIDILQISYTGYIIFPTLQCLVLYHIITWKNYVPFLFFSMSIGIIDFLQLEVVGLSWLYLAFLPLLYNLLERYVLQRSLRIVLICLQATVYRTILYTWYNPQLIMYPSTWLYLAIEFCMQSVFLVWITKPCMP